MHYPVECVSHLWNSPHPNPVANFHTNGSVVHTYGPLDTSAFKDVKGKLSLLPQFMSD